MVPRAGTCSLWFSHPRTCTHTYTHIHTHTQAHTHKNICVRVHTHIYQLNHSTILIQHSVEPVYTYSTAWSHQKLTTIDGCAFRPPEFYSSVAYVLQLLCEITVCSYPPSQFLLCLSWCLLAHCWTWVFVLYLAKRLLWWSFSLICQELQP